MIKKVSFIGSIIHIISTEGAFETDMGTGIYEVSFLKDKVFVLLKYMELVGTDLYNRNILCLDEKGKQLWRVEDPDWYRSGKVRTENPFIGMGVPKDGTLIAATWDGFHIKIDINTGKLGKDWDYHK